MDFATPRSNEGIKSKPKSSLEFKADSAFARIESEVESARA
ncbi:MULTISPECIES: hypothetical protein [unclassified Helicobacter]|nr:MULTISPECIES: hypothetical protein [unclassified Helicobacter]